jgi:hypothetical protein
MPLIAYSEFVERVKQNVFPDTDNDGNEAHLEPTNLRFPHRTYVQNALITAQTYIECLRGNNVQSYTLDDAMVNCGVGIFELPDHARIGAVYAYKPEKGCTRQHYVQQSVNNIMCFVDQFATCECKEESDICNAVRDGDAVCDNLSLCDDWTGEESDAHFKCEDRIFAVGSGGRLYVAPRIPCGYRLAVHWEGLKYRYADADLISDDPDLLDLVSTYVQAERARTFDRDLPLYRELLGAGPPRRGMGGSAFHQKLAAMAHRCREERRIRTRPCLELWDDSAVSSENIGAQLDPVPTRDESGIEFERCDECPEGQYSVDGTCYDCLEPVVSITSNLTTIVAGESVIISWTSSNVLPLDSSVVTLEHDGETITLERNESGTMTFSPEEDTTYTIRAKTVCGDVTATLDVTVGDVGDCGCPMGLPDCLTIDGFSANTFTDRVSLAFIGDYGDVANSPNPENVEEQVQAFAPDYLISAGDNRYGVSMDTMFALLPYYKSLRDAQRMYSVAQNHDVDDDGGLADYLAAFPYLPGDQRNYSVRLGPVEVFFRETHDTGTAPPDLAASEAWLTAAVAASTARWKIVVTGDAPATSTSGSDYPGNQDSQLDYAGMGVDLVISGDSHQYERFDATGAAGVPSIVTGHGGRVLTGFNVTPATGSQVRIQDYGFLACEADGDSLTVQMIDDDGVVRDTLELTKDEELVECASGNASLAEAWDGTLERVTEDECDWGFDFGHFSLDGQNVSARIVLASCTGGVNVYRLHVSYRSGEGEEIIWQGSSNNSVIGTYIRDEAITCGPMFVTVISCDEGDEEECEENTIITFDPPSGSFVAFPTIVVMSAGSDEALIYYTLDGSAPTNNSTLYTGPVSVADGEILKARAYTNDCIGDVFEADYQNADELYEYFHFDFICDSKDRAGIFHEFAPNGSSPDYHWRAAHGWAAGFTVERMELYETNSEGVWVTGQAWATDSPVQPAELEGADFSIYPMVVFEDDDTTQINNAYLSTFGSFAAGEYLWHMYGQPFIPLVGYFKLIVSGTFDGVPATFYKLIPHDCYYCDYDDYTYCDDPEPQNPTTSNIINVDIREEGATTKSGAAAVGGPGDYWNTFNFDPEAVGAGNSAQIDLKWSNGLDAGFFLIETNESTTPTIFTRGETTGSTDPMMANAGVVVADGWVKRLLFSDIPAGVYDLYVYGHGEGTAEVVTCKAITPAQSTEFKSTSAVENWDGSFVKLINYVVFENISFLQIEEHDLAIEFAVNQNSWINGIQLVKKA